MVALRSQGNWRWEGPLGTPLGLVHWKRGRRAWQPTPVFLPGEPHGQRSLVGYSPWDLKESDMTERLSTAQLLKLMLYLVSEAI